MGDDVQSLARRSWPVMLVGSSVLLFALLAALTGSVAIVPVLAGAAGALSTACPTPAATATVTGTVTATAQAATATPGATASTTATPTPYCVNPNANNIVYWAMQAEAHLYDCGPKQMDECYDAGFPQPLIDWWIKTCAGCSEWQNGNLQCVMLAGAVFGVAGLPLYWGPRGVANGIDFWYNYFNYPNWVEIPAYFEPGTTTPAPQSARGLPAPGDLIAWYNQYTPWGGHLAVVVQVIPPQTGHSGSVTFFEANGPGPLFTEPLNADLTVSTWPGYFVAGYIRPLSVPPVLTPTPTTG